MTLKKIGNVYHAVFRSAEGKRKTITTRCTDKHAASKVAADSGIAKLEAAAKSGRLTREAIGQIVTGRKLTVSKAFEYYAKWMEAKARSRSTIANNLTVLHAWARDMKILNVPPSAITVEHVSGWINSRELDSKLGTRTLNLAIIRTLFSFLCARGWVVSDVAREASVDQSLLSHEQKEVRARLPFTEPELRRVLAHVHEDLLNAEGELRRIDDKHKGEQNPSPIATSLMERIQRLRFWQFAVRISKETGLRLGDIAGLEWSCFETPGYVTVHTDKSDKRMVLPISDELSELVTTIPVTDSTYLFPIQRAIDRDAARRSLLSVQFRRLCDAAGVKGKSFHCLRHTVASKQYTDADKARLAKKLAESLTVGQIAQLLGHSNPTTTKGYVHG